MAYQQCVLDGYTYPVNPPENINPKVKRIVATETLIGRYFSDWGNDPSLRDINQSWPTMTAEMYDALVEKADQEGTLSFTDDDGTSYTVLCEYPTFQRKTPQAEAYQGVRVVMHIVSSP